MPATKTRRTLQAPATNAAAGTTAGIGLDLATTFRWGGIATLIVTNGVTGPTIPCDAIIDHKPDGTNWVEFVRLRASTVPNAVHPFSVDIPIGVMDIRSRFTGNTAQGVTVEAYFQEVSSNS